MSHGPAQPGIEREVAGDVGFPAQRGPHRDEVAHGRDIVHAHYRSTRVEPGADRGERSPQPLMRRAPGQRPHEVLARHGEEDGPAQGDDRGQ